MLNTVLRYWKLIAALGVAFFIWTIKTIDILVVVCTSEIFNFFYRIINGKIPPMLSASYIFGKNEYEHYYNLRENIASFISFIVVAGLAVTSSYYFHKFLSFCERVYFNMWPPVPPSSPALAPLPAVLLPEVPGLQEESPREEGRLSRTASVSSHLSGQNSQDPSPRGPNHPQDWPVEPDESMNTLNHNSGSGTAAAVEQFRRRAGSAFSRLQSSQTFSNFDAVVTADAGADGDPPSSFSTNSRISGSGEPPPLQRVSHILPVPPREESSLRLRPRPDGSGAANSQFVEPMPPRYLPSVAPPVQKAPAAFTAQTAERLLNSAEGLRDALKAFQRPE